MCLVVCLIVFFVSLVCFIVFFVLCILYFVLFFRSEKGKWEGLLDGCRGGVRKGEGSAYRLPWCKNPTAEIKSSWARERLER